MSHPYGFQKRSDGPGPRRLIGKVHLINFDQEEGPHRFLCGNGHLGSEVDLPTVAFDGSKRCLSCWYTRQTEKS